MKKLVIEGRFLGLNDYINIERGNRYQAANVKKQLMDNVYWCIIQQLKGVKFTKPVVLHYTWYEKDKRRDKDNICSVGMKIIQDALVKAGTLKNDGWNEIASFTHDFKVDSKNPRIEVEIEELGETKE